MKKLVLFIAVIITLASCYHSERVKCLDCEDNSITYVVINIPDEVIKGDTIHFKKNTHGTSIVYMQCVNCAPEVRTGVVLSPKSHFHGD